LAEKFWPITSLIVRVTCLRRTSTMRPSSSTTGTGRPFPQLLQLGHDAGDAAVAQLAHLHLAGLPGTR